MNILIINGSPAGDDSITLQTLRYIRKFHPAHDWALLNVGKRIRSIEHDFAPARKALERAELLIFVYENPALGAGGSEALLAMGQDKKTPFDVE